MYGEALLGPFPDSWIPKLYWMHQVTTLQFWNTATGEKTYEDPRLPPLPDGWELHKESGEEDDWYREFWDDATANYYEEDPRLTRKALEEQGVQIETLTLV